MIRIGIGISTYNRKDSLKMLIDSIKKHTKTVPHTLFCAVDGSTDGTVEMLMKEGIEFTYGPNIGPNRNKNRIFRRFSQYNYLFMFEDDMEIIRDNWIEIYILASTMSNIPYFIYAPQDDPNYKENRIESVGSVKIAWCNTYSPKLIVLNRRVIEKVGAIDERFNRYYCGSEEHFNRIVACGLLPKGLGIPHVIESKNFIRPIPNEKVPKLLAEDERIEERQASQFILKRLTTELSQTQNFFRKL